MRKAAVILAVLAAALAWALWPGGPVELTIPPGLRAAKTAHLLKEKGVIPSTLLFRAAAKWTGADRKLKPGAYKLRRNMPLWSLLAALEAGGNNGVKVIIPEGFSAKQIAQRLEADGVCPAPDFLRYVAVNRMEGYLFPTTYFFDPGTSPELAAHRMREEFDRRIGVEYQAADPKPALSINQVLTLASIVQREAVLSQEGPMIAAVYSNRMKKRMRLEADPTVQYALGEWKKGLTSKDLHVDSPYNTYVHYGLPPGPICSPGLTAFRAALHPAETDAIYFVADNTGGHVFSATHDEHLKAKRSFKRGLKAIKERIRREQAQKSGQ